MYVLATPLSGCAVLFVPCRVQTLNTAASLSDPAPV